MMKQRTAFFVESVFSVLNVSDMYRVCGWGLTLL